MRKLIIVAVLAYVAYGYFNGTLQLPWSSKSTPSASYGGHAPASTPAAQSPSPTSSPAFRCDGRQHCSQMRSYEEARFFLRNCPNTKMDGDRDGIPCEQQFGR